ncbi:hypothetical protein [Blautia hydrogenotrophica]|jgi:hypothetical protein|uniref:hypothetical protein n=1 Tax=Blautia hydrogenotrophica TaxID=53443 RepID=UPI003AB7A32D
MSFRKEGYSDIDKWRKTVRNYNKRYYKQTAKYAPRPWTENEIQMLFDETINDRELSEKIHRSMKSIVLKRHRVRKETDKPL